MNASAKLVVPPHVMARRVGDEIVILDLDKGTYFGLDAVGSRIWDLIGAGETRTTICEAVVAEYEVAAEVAQADVDRLVAELRERGLVEGG